MRWLQFLFIVIHCCILLQRYSSALDLSLSELLREKALKEILPLMEKDERNLKDRRTTKLYDRNLLRRFTLSRLSAPSKQIKRILLLCFTSCTYSLLALFISVLCSGKWWTLSHSAGSYQHVGGPGHQ